MGAKLSANMLRLLAAIPDLEAGAAARLRHDRIEQAAWNVVNRGHDLEDAIVELRKALES